MHIMISSWYPNEITECKKKKKTIFLFFFALLLILNHDFVLIRTEPSQNICPLIIEKRFSTFRDSLCRI